MSDLLPFERTTYAPGDRIVYRLKATGGYGFITRQPGVVQRVGSSRVTVKLDSGRVVSVRPFSLESVAPGTVGGGK